ncbi:glutathione S-transferase Mu 4-like [Panulirus ornatus]|uniref:glutathione S-transferase Mu 4-like n=1 Tax=Panulirus ornatus TaxID=150431 RepID=UPI003A850B0C
MAPVLGYWNIRGLGQSIRLLLSYTGTEFEDKMYVPGPPPDFSPSDWTSVKFTLGLDFPNLPYYIDGDVKVTQSNAVLRYIARKHDMCGKTEEEKTRVDILENQAMDMRRAFVKLCYETYNTKKQEYLDDLPAAMKLLSDFLGDRPWFAGDNITFVDFLIYELLDVHQELDSSCLDGKKNLQDFVKNFEALPAMKKYMASPQFLKTPLNGPMAIFGNK